MTAITKALQDTHEFVMPELKRCCRQEQHLVEGIGHRSVSGLQIHAAATSTDSRIWGGFHFRDSCEDGEASRLVLGLYILNLGLFDRLPE